MDLTAQIEALLFWQSEPMTVKQLVRVTAQDEAAVNQALGDLTKSLAGRGIVLVRQDDEVTLATRPEVSRLIETLTTEELSKELGKAGLETLAIVLYQGPVSRAEVDYVRGVNSTFTLRHLLIRDLVLRVPSAKDARGYHYRPTLKLLSYLGISRLEDLPDYQSVRDELAKLSAPPETADGQRSGN